MKLTPSQIDYMVIDTQGAEMKCLLGLGEYIENLRYITAEVSATDFYKGGARMDEIDAYLESRGFLRVSDEPGYKHGDALYLRMSPSPDGQDTVMNDDILNRDKALRAQGNDLINRLYNDSSGRDSESLEAEMLTLYETYEDILLQPISRDICTLMTRYALEKGMGKAFSRFIHPLGWG